MKITDPEFRDKVIQMEGTVLKYASALFVLGLLFKYMDMPGASLLLVCPSGMFVMMGMLVYMTFEKMCSQRLGSLSLGLICFAIMSRVLLFPASQFMAILAVLSSAAYIYFAMKENKLSSSRSRLVMIALLILVLIFSIPKSKEIANSQKLDFQELSDSTYIDVLKTSGHLEDRIYWWNLYARELAEDGDKENTLKAIEMVRGYAKLLYRGDELERVLGQTRFNRNLVEKDGDLREWQFR